MPAPLAQYKLLREDEQFAGRGIKNILLSNAIKMEMKTATIPGNLGVFTAIAIDCRNSKSWFLTP
jgi:hypothetical protein